MFHELSEILHAYTQRPANDYVLATVVDLDGSSYRKPGVRMLIDDCGNYTGAVSGGCVEQEIVRQASTVFKTNQACVITYDGRYRLGCEGTLYILIEPFAPSDELIQAVEYARTHREDIIAKSPYQRIDQYKGNFGTVFYFPKQNKSIAAYKRFDNNPELLCFEQTMEAPFRLIIFGAEHDAGKLSMQASILGWEVIIIAKGKEAKTIEQFPGASKIVNIEPEFFDDALINKNTAVVIMNHSYQLDLKYLRSLYTKELCYLGIIGAAKRREALFNDLIQNDPLMEYELLDRIHAPAGLHLGAITSQEIALAICAEILAIKNQKEAISLKTFTGFIHEQ